MDINDLEEIFKTAKKDTLDVAIELTVPSRKDTEIIIIKNGNLDYKLDYYKKNYTKNLVLNRCEDIKILSAKVGNFKII